jgi:hypothetical protein
VRTSGVAAPSASGRIRRRGAAGWRARRRRRGRPPTLGGRPPRRADQGTRPSEGGAYARRG